MPAARRSGHRHPLVRAVCGVVLGVGLGVLVALVVPRDRDPWSVSSR